MLLRLMGIMLDTVLHGCRSLPFNPSKGMDRTPADIDLDYEDIFLTTSDNEQVNGWYVPANADQPGPGTGRTLLFFHGNGGSIANRLPSLFVFQNLGLSQFIIDYRGYGRSSGKPTVLGTLRDARAAWDWLGREKNCAPEEIILFGRSLGGGVAASLAAEVQAGALILESTFTSLVELARDMYPFMPVRWFLPEDYATREKLDKVHTPVLVAHSPEDEVINFKHGMSLLASCNGPKQFLELHGPHDSGFLENLPVYVKGLETFLSSLPPLMTGRFNR